MAQPRITVADDPDAAGGLRVEVTGCDGRHSTTATRFAAWLATHWPALLELSDARLRMPIDGRQAQRWRDPPPMWDPPPPGGDYVR